MSDMNRPTEAEFDATIDVNVVTNWQAYIIALKDENETLRGERDQLRAALVTIGRAFVTATGGVPEV